MFFKTEDEQQLQRALAADKKDRKALAQLERDLEALHQPWTKLQEKIEQLAAQYANSDRTYSREVCEAFWRDRDPSLKAEIERLISERDGLTAALPAQINALKQAIHRRHSIAVGDFQSWSSTIGERLPEPLKGEIMTARMDIAKLADLAEIFATSRRWIERVGEVDLPTTPPLLNLGGVVRKLAA